MLRTKILSSPFWDSSISSEDMRSLRSLIYRYSAKYSVDNRLLCGGRLSLRETIGRIEYGLALISVFDQINDLIYIDIDKLDKRDLPILMTLQNNFAAELAMYKGVLCALESPKLIEYIDR